LRIQKFRLAAATLQKWLRAEMTWLQTAGRLEAR
jgi:hypothetical protein